MSIKLAIVEDQELFRRLLVSLCTIQFGYEVVCEAGTAAEALARIPPAQPDVVVLDLQLPDGDGLDVAEKLFDQRMDQHVLALTSLRDELTIYRIRSIGIQGFVDKNVQDPEVLRTAIESVAAGRVYYAEVVQRVQQTMRADPESFVKRLSERERALLQLLGRGISNEEASTLTGLTAGAVHSHRRNIMKKLGAASQADLMRYALRKGFVRPDSSYF